MKHLLTLLAALAILAAPAAAQTIKSLGFNTTNGQVVANTGTNFLTFTNNIWLSVIGLTFKLNDAITIESEGETYIDSYFKFNQEIRFNPTNSAAATTRANLGLNSTNVYVYAATGLWDVNNEKIAVRMLDMDVDVDAGMVRTNGPTNTTNAVRWINVLSGTNIYKLPLYQ